MRSLPIDVTAGPRAELLRCVHDRPGIHLRCIERETRLALGQVLYHLDRLERMGLVASTRDAGFRRYFAAHEVSRGDKRFLGALRQPFQRRVQLALLEHGAQNHKELRARLGVAGSTLSFHLQRLVDAGVLVRRRRGTANVYSLADGQAVRRALLSYRRSFDDPEVDRYVRTEIGERRELPVEAVATLA